MSKLRETKKRLMECKGLYEALYTIENYKFYKAMDLTSNYIKFNRVDRMTRIIKQGEALFKIYNNKED